MSSAVKRSDVVSSPSSKAASASSAEKIVVPAAKLGVLLGGELGGLGHDRQRLLGVGLDVVEGGVPGVDEGLDVARAARRSAPGVTTMWSEMVPGKSALSNTHVRAGPLEGRERERGEHADAVELAVGEAGRGGVGEHAAEVDVVLGEPDRVEALQQQEVVDDAVLGGDRSCPRGPRSRSTDSSQMMASLPVELSLVTTITCSSPAATPNIVSLSVWVLPSSWPAAMASSEPR